MVKKHFYYGMPTRTDPKPKPIKRETALKLLNDHNQTQLLFNSFKRDKTKVITAFTVIDRNDYRDPKIIEPILYETIVYSSNENTNGIIDWYHSYSDAVIGHKRMVAVLGFDISESINSFGV